MIFFIRRVTNPRRIVVAEPIVTRTAATINTSTTSSPAHGIDPEVLSSSTIFAYSSSSQEKLDCVVCLSEMKDGENARRLSWCGHCFHAECVDEWLRSHSTCPLCRSSAKTEFPELHV
uniref:RING-type E3 ubiquitin transferase n=1 Tax=Ananas comosus var. bracteatus TaxID=296719 RepID=A0A6V7PFW2_ANACO|nr:unnamed protein product [Ananas comosus var. bracteatus]